MERKGEQHKESEGEGEMREEGRKRKGGRWGCTVE